MCNYSSNLEVGIFSPFLLAVVWTTMRDFPANKHDSLVLSSPADIFCTKFLHFHMSGAFLGFGSKIDAKIDLTFVSKTFYGVGKHAVQMQTSRVLNTTVTETLAHGRWK